MGIINAKWRGGYIKQNSLYRLVSDINITAWNNKANSSHTHSANDINLDQLYGGTISLGDNLKCDTENGVFLFNFRVGATSFKYESGKRSGVDIFFDADKENPHIEMIEYGNDIIYNKYYLPSGKSGNIALIDDLSMKGTYSNMWFPGFNVNGMGYVFTIPISNKSINITVTDIQVFTGYVWHDVPLIRSNKQANQLICTCQISTMDDLENGKVYLTKATIVIN